MFPPLKKSRLAKWTCVGLAMIAAIAGSHPGARAEVIDAHMIRCRFSMNSGVKVAQNASPGVLTPSQEDLDRQAAEIERAEAEKGEQKNAEETQRKAAAATAEEEKERQNAARDRAQEVVMAQQMNNHHRAKLYSHRLAGYALGGIGLALGGAGLLSYSAAQSKERSIENGGFATGNDISTAASQVRLYQGLSGTLWAVGGAALLTGIIVVLANGDDSSETAPKWAWIISGVRW